MINTIFKDKLPDKPGIYLVRNIINNHKYIGQSYNIKIRFQRHHLSDYKNKKNSCYDCKFYKAIRLYGEDNFEVSIIELCDINKLDEREQYWIEYYDTYKNGYNSTIGGQNWTDKIHSKETELKRKQTLEKSKKLKSENHPRAKLSNQEVITIRQRYIDGESIDDILLDYNHLYSKDTFKNIIFGRSYKSVGNIPTKKQIRYTNKNKSFGKMSDEDVRNIRKEYALGNTSYPKLAKKYNVSIPTIANIVNKKFYKNIK